MAAFPRSISTIAGVAPAPLGTAGKKSFPKRGDFEAGALSAVVTMGRSGVRKSVDMSLVAFKEVSSTAQATQLG